MTTREPDKKPSQANNPNSVLRYSGMAFQILACILLGFWGGMKLDEWMGNKIPFLTIILGLAGVMGGVYLSIKDFLKKK